MFHFFLFVFLGHALICDTHSLGNVVSFSRRYRSSTSQIDAREDALHSAQRTRAVSKPCWRQHARRCVCVQEQPCACDPCHSLHISSMMSVSRCLLEAPSDCATSRAQAWRHSGGRRGALGSPLLSRILARGSARRRLVLAVERWPQTVPLFCGGQVARCRMSTGASVAKR